MKHTTCATLLVVLALGCGGPKMPTGNGKEGVPDNWTHKEVLARLNEKGLKLKQISTDVGAQHGTPMFFVTESSGINNGKAAGAAYDKKSPDVVYCRLHKTAEEAKGSVETPGSGFASGRFVFVGQPPLVYRVADALP